MMEGVNTSETSVNFYETTRRNIPEGCHLHTRGRENLNVTTIVMFVRNCNTAPCVSIVVRSETLVLISVFQAVDNNSKACLNESRDSSMPVGEPHL
jgi:hypothetical protein